MYTIGGRVNPFRFGDPVTGEYYVGRPALKDTVSKFLTSGVNVVLIGPRRYGKTSFILNLLGHLEKNSKKETLYVDLLNITSHRDFYLQLIMAIKNKRSVLKNFKAWIKNLPDVLRPTLSIETERSGEISLNIKPFTPNEDVKQMILVLLEDLLKSSSHIVIAFDEFQSVAEIEDGGWLEATLRQKMQLNKNAFFIFSGSRRAIIHDMFNNHKRPFYHSCQLIDFPKLDDSFTEWIQDRFKKVGIESDSSSINYLREVVEDTPNYVQMACFHIVADGAKKLDKLVVDKILKTMVNQNAYAYQTMMKSLSVNQQRVLRMAAKIKEGVFTKEVILQFEIPSPQHVAQAIKALKEKQILDEETGKGKVIFDDPLFAIWLNLEF